MAPALHVSTDSAIDLVQELRLRRWARENYVAAELRDPNWHAHVLDEMQRKDQEQVAVDTFSQIARRIVPLVPENGLSLHGPHQDFAHSRVLARIPFVE